MVRCENCCKLLQGEHFVDRNPKYFELILDYLRTKKIKLQHLSQQEKEDLLEEAQFYQIATLIDKLTCAAQPLSSFDLNGPLNPKYGQYYAVTNAGKTLKKDSHDKIITSCVINDTPFNSSQSYKPITIIIDKYISNRLQIGFAGNVSQVVEECNMAISSNSWYIDESWNLQNNDTFTFTLHNGTLQIVRKIDKKSVQYAIPANMTLYFVFAARRVGSQISIQ